jgi:dienelactone hydrolase
MIASLRLYGALLGAALLAATPASEAHAAEGVRLVLAPERVLEGESVEFRVEGLRPGSLVTLYSQSVVLRDGQKRPRGANATFKADERGVVDPASAAPTEGSYQGPDLRGLFWSQAAAPEKPPQGGPGVPQGGLPEPQSLSTDTVALTVVQGGVVLDTRVLTFLPHNGDVLQEDVREAGLVGRFYSQRGATARPVVVILSGSEGGLSFADALGPKLAARGYAAFGLAYFAPPPGIEGVPTALHRIPVELLEKARSWLAGRSEADVARFGVVGGSKGGELALVLASTFDWIDAVVAFAPADRVWQGFRYGSGEDGMGSSWTRGGIDLPFVPEIGLRDELVQGRKPGGEIRLARVRRASFASAGPETLAAARIPIERSRAALLLVGGGDDEVADSGPCVERLKEMLDKARYARPYQALVYPEAGHAVFGTGWRPTTMSNAGPFKDGGTPEADAHAQADSWARMLEFLQRELAVHRTTH